MDSWNGGLIVHRGPIIQNILRPKACKSFVVGISLAMLLSTIHFGKRE